LFELSLKLSSLQLELQLLVQKLQLVQLQMLQL
jgi:hypothetical protein